MSAAVSPDRALDRLLALLAEGDGRIEPGDPAVLRVVGRDGLRRRRVERALVDRLVAEDLASLTVDTDTPSTSRLSLTVTGRARLRRAGADGPDFRRQHGAVASRAVTPDAPPLVVDEAESPLAWLARRRDKDGRTFLSAPRVAAGERLRADFTLARMMPTVTSNWSAGRIGTGKSGPGGVGDLTDRALAARDRVRAALDAVGTDLADLLLDVCCFLKGLETIESDRRWPARSAKVVLDIALGRLAAHYGLAEEARGLDRARRLRAWGTGDHRPTTGTALDRLPRPEGL
jgi:hypothetical protein